MASRATPRASEGKSSGRGDGGIKKVTVQGPPLNVAQPASMHGYCGENLENWSKLVCKTPTNPHFSAAPEQLLKKNPPAKVLTKTLDAETVRNAIVLHEILSPPVSRRRRGRERR